MPFDGGLFMAYKPNMSSTTLCLDCMLELGLVVRLRHITNRVVIHGHKWLHTQVVMDTTHEFKVAHALRYVISFDLATRFDMSLTLADIREDLVVDAAGL